MQNKFQKGDYVKLFGSTGCYVVIDDAVERNFSSTHKGGQFCEIEKIRTEKGGKHSGSTRIEPATCLELFPFDKMIQFHEKVAQDFRTLRDAANNSRQKD